MYKNENNLNLLQRLTDAIEKSKHNESCLRAITDCQLENDSPKIESNAYRCKVICKEKE